MTTIAHDTAVPVVRRDTRPVLRRVALGAVAVTRNAAAALLDRLAVVRDAGQLGGDYETEVGRWSGARI